MKLDLRQGDCMELIKNLPDNSVDAVITDIPYDGVNRENSGLAQLKNSNKGKADIITFDLDNFLNEVYRVIKSTAIIFCGIGQVSTIYNYFDNKQKGTVRHLIWEKTNPVPANGQFIYLSGIENAVWYKKPGGTFNGFCKNTVFRYPIQSNQIHPTEKNHELLEELVVDNSNEGDTILDTCMGSGSTGLACLKHRRNFIGFELDETFFKLAHDRLVEAKENYSYQKESLI